MPIDPRRPAYPDDWIHPDEWISLPATASFDTGQPVPSSQSSVSNAGIANPLASPTANPSTMRPDPFAAYWAQVPASRLNEIQPINFAGNPTDPASKIPLSPEDHYLLNVWWGRIKRGLLKDSGTNRGESK
jgi:hypothetical protein